MPRVAIVAGVVILALAIGLYSYFAGREYVFRFTEDELKVALSKQLPIRKSYLLIFEVVLDHPRVTLVEGSDRVNAGLDIILNIHVNDEPLPLGGSIDVSGGVRYDHEAAAFFLTDPVVEQLALQGIPEEYAQGATRVLTRALGDYYRERPIYTLSPTDLGQAAARLVLKDVAVQQQQLVITLGI